MRKKILWLFISSLTVLSLLIVACGAPETPTTPTAPTTPTTPAAPSTPTTPAAPVETPSQKEAVSSDTPKYGGTLNLALTGDPTSGWDPSYLITSNIVNLTNEELWAGDWAKGIAGGYGTKESDWGFGNNDLFFLKSGLIAESWNWTIDDANNEGTLVYQIRKGVHYGLNPESEASRLVKGREVTADDVVYCLKRTTTDKTTYLYRRNPELRTAQISKTGPMEVTVKTDIETFISAIDRYGDAAKIYPPEVVEKYGDMNDWKMSVGTGPFILADYVAGSQATLVRNPNYWMKDPVGPGKGNQLPYLDSVTLFILPDASTRYAALRTGKIDMMEQIYGDDATQMKKTAPNMLYKSAPSRQGRGTPAFMKITSPPFNDVRVRQAVNMAIDRNAILQGLYGGEGQIMTWPFAYIQEYGPMHVALDDPDVPEKVKEIYSYNPEKAKQLLAEAGYPQGFKTEIVLEASQVDYYSIIKDYLSKVGVDLSLDVRESGVVANMKVTHNFNVIITDTTGPAAVFWQGSHIFKESGKNYNPIDDPYIEKTMEAVRATMLTDEKESMKMFRDLTRDYILEQAYTIPDVIGSVYVFWWPWVKNYSGEITVGYDDPIWPQWVWYDKALKKSMGY